MDDSSYLNLLRFKDLRSSYTKRAKEVRKRNKEWVREKYESFSKEFNNELTRCREHDEIVNLCIHPFSESNPERLALGYNYMRADPLYEKGIDNFDFLICRIEGKRPIAIFGEVKSSITNFKRSFSEFDDKVKNVEDNREYIKNEYLGIDNEPLFEYVFAVKSNLSPDVRDIIVEEDKNIILWIADLYDGSLKLARSPKGEGRNKMQHHDHSLSKYLGQSVRSSRNTFDFFPQTHMLRKLKILILSLEERNILSIERLRRNIFANCFFLTPKERQAEFESIVQNGLEIGFLVDDEKKVGEYRISSVTSKLSELEEEIQERWKTAKIKEFARKNLEESINILQSQILDDQRKRPTLDN
jgi:hypothetical protein